MVNHGESWWIMVNHGESWWITCLSFPDWAWNRTSKASQRSQCIHHVALRLELPAPTDDIRYLCAHIADILVRKDMQAQTQSQWTLKVKKQDVKFALQEIEHHLRKSPGFAFFMVFSGVLSVLISLKIFFHLFSSFFLFWFGDARSTQETKDTLEVVQCSSSISGGRGSSERHRTFESAGIWRDLEGSGGNWREHMAVSQNIKPRSIPWTHRTIHTPDPYQNAGDPDRSIRLDHRGPIHTRILTQPHIGSAWVLPCSATCVTLVIDTYWYWHLLTHNHIAILPEHDA